VALVIRQERLGEKEREREKEEEKYGTYACDELLPVLLSCADPRELFLVDASGAQHGEDEEPAIGTSRGSLSFNMD